MTERAVASTQGLVLADGTPWPEDAIEVARVIDAWGVKGGIKLHPFSSDPQALFCTKKWFVQPALPQAGAVRKPGAPAGAAAGASVAVPARKAAPASDNRTPARLSQPALLRVKSAKEQGDVIVATIDGLDDRNGAEALKGARVFVSRSAFPTPDSDDEFYWIDLIGLNVVNREGQALGTVTDLLDTGPHCVLRCSLPAGEAPKPGDAAERLIPFVSAYIDRVSLAERLIVADWVWTTEFGPGAVRFDVITLFPELFEPFARVGVTRRAFESKAVDVRLWPLRDFTEDTYRRVDDRPFGGGPGMVMLVEPLARALAAIRADQEAVGGPRLPVVLFSPAGKPLTQPRVEALAASPGAVLLCGRYEGIDQRFIDAHVDEEISLGDYVLSGGELPALTLIDAVARLQPGVLHDAASHQQDSFSDGLLDCPHYSRPEVLGEALRAQLPGADAAVPPVLMSGHHAQIALWRRQQQLSITWQRRPELIEAARKDGRLSKADEQFLKTLL